jgi:hypothetical protein
VTKPNRINTLGTLVFSTREVVDRLRHQVARAEGESSLTVPIELDQLKEICTRMEELMLPSMDLRSILIAHRNSEEKAEATR